MLVPTRNIASNSPRAFARQVTSAQQSLLRLHAQHFPQTHRRSPLCTPASHNRQTLDIAQRGPLSLRHLCFTSQSALPVFDSVGFHMNPENFSFKRFPQFDKSLAVWEPSHGHWCVLSDSSHVLSDCIHRLTTCAYSPSDYY